MLSEEIKAHIKNSPAVKQWEKAGYHIRHGIAIPIFSLRTKKSCAIGEYLDLLPLIDFCVSCHMNIIQLLPINEMSGDFSPYNAISSCALDPIYLSLLALPHLEENSTLKNSLESFHILNRQKRIHYDMVKEMKLKWLFAYYNLHFDKFKNSESYASFLKQNPWLEEYALFRTLKQRYSFNNFLDWPEELKNLSPEQYPILVTKYASQIEFYTFLQYLCFSQMIEVKNYASKKRVELLGDIPIFVSVDSVDVWRSPYLFDRRHVAGCPPDDLAPKGQKWGFFLFNWEALKKEDYAFWKRRLNVASSLYHLYRIDHAVGFFRIFAMEVDQTPFQGKFIPKDHSLWEKLGRDNLKMMLDSTILLPIAEDLGLIPSETHKVLFELSIAGTKIMRWEKNGDSFKPIDQYPPLSLTSLSNHDIDPLAIWWRNSPDAKQWAYQKQIPYESTIAPKVRFELLKDSHHTSSLFHINPLQEYLALFEELSYPNHHDERINVPGKKLPTNWTYRIRPFLEDIQEHHALKESIQKLIHKEQLA